MKNGYFLIFCLLIGFKLFSQDTYHNKLQSTLQSEYGLPVGNWVFFDNENAILSEAGSYGGSFTVLEASETDFSKLARATISNAGNNPWDAGWNIKNQSSIQGGDKLLLVLSIRSVGGTGKVNIFAEHATTFAKEVILTVDVSEEWRQYLIPFESSGSFNAQGLTFGFHLAHQAQTIEIGGYTAINYGGTIALNTLPSQLNNDKYDGAAVDAPWRATAAERIASLRKSNLSITVKTPEGALADGAKVSVNMIKHEFAFGSAITANRIAGNNIQNNTYENKIHNLDGQGHGFNWIVFENDLKWPAWEDAWLVSRPELVNAIAWLKNRGIKIRGHTLLWPGDSHMPVDISGNNTNLAFIKERINGHLEDMLNHPGIKGEIAEWDVLNEITTNRSIENYFKSSEGYVSGREILSEVFQKAREEDANTGLWLNDFVTLSQDTKPGNVNYDNLKLFTRELIDAGVDIEGLGFQGHINGFPNGIPSVLETLDDFYNEFGLKAKITEFDLPSFVEEDLAAQYLRDFMTAIFSHESMNGFLFWSFWDGATYMNEGTNLFRLDWSQTPAGDAFVDLVFKEWWTKENLIASADGAIQTSVFKGLHEISYESDGAIITDTVNIIADTTLVIVAPNISTPTTELDADQALAIVYPNPAKAQLFIEKLSPDEVTIRLFDLRGKLLLEQRSDARIAKLDVAHLTGLFIVEVFDGEKTVSKKVVVGR